MVVSILHLSDIHFKAGHSIVLNRIDKIFNSIKNEVKGKDAFFIVTSGDISFSGNETEFINAKRFYPPFALKI